MELPHLPRAVVFDMDGLLFDSETLYQEAGILAAVESGHHVTPEVLNQTVGLPWSQSRSLLLTHLGPDFPIDAFQATWLQHFWVIAETRLMLKPGASELLDALDELGLPRAIATSSAHHTVDRHLKAHNLAGRFDHIVAHGDYERGKPQPDPFLKASERLRVEPWHCLALEDSHNGVRSAWSAGMMTIMVPDILQPTAEISGLCALIARDLLEVRDLILAAAAGSHSGHRDDGGERRLPGRRAP
jgi:beta-phosphoglucomutase-like phosphatase (HAD superfamily)